MSVASKKLSCSSFVGGGGGGGGVYFAPRIATDFFTNNTTWMEEGGRWWKGSNSLIWDRHKKVDLQCDLEHVYKKVEEVNGSTGLYFFPCCLTGLREGRRS